MRTTLIIDDPVLERARKMATRKNKPLSELVTDAVEEYLLRFAGEKRSMDRHPDLKAYSMGKPSVDINNRDELYRRMEG